MLRPEGAADGAVAFHPAGDLVRVDVERRDDVFTAEVGGDDVQVYRPVHAARGIAVAEPDVVHVDAGLVFAL